ncbi:MAG: hypothetical protein A4E36_01715 [Methanoregulaceae archaeon PtaB.Bin009]|nr:MAG: hypothetical protein A4E36_01715 [Methanoregulaceae archaeon PtaB.Bin009]OPY40951.1 MAG: hypothetical protein A4E41_01131 [Methanoregulaceae archaeon PtaU1.Bin066]
MARFCEKCGASLAGNAQFCEECGAPVPAEAPAPPPQPNASAPAPLPGLGTPPKKGPAPSKKGLPLPLIIGAGAAVVILIAAIAIVPGLISPEPANGSLPGGTIPPTPTSSLEPGPVDTAPSETEVAVQVTRDTGISTEDINLHFMDVAFGGGNLFLERLPLSSKRTTISLNAGEESDKVLIESFASNFNLLSQSNKLFENTKTGQTGDIRIKFLPSDGLKAIDLTSDMKWLNREYTRDGITCAKIKGYDIYLNSDMEGDMRDHYLLRSLLYTLGFKGDSLHYQDSIFAYPENTMTELSFLDEKTLQVMYGLGMNNGMTVEDVKRVLFFR